MDLAEAREVLEAGRTSTGDRKWQQVVDLPMDDEVEAAALVAELLAS